MNDSNLGLGSLQQHLDIPEWVCSDEEWVCSDEVSVNFFGGKPLRFVITDPLPNPNLVQQIERALQNFFQLDTHYRDSLSDLVYESYEKTLDAVDMDPLELSTKEDIWKYVYPTEVYISQRHRRDEAIYVQVACECEWEVEHGLQLVFKDGARITRVSQQDGHLTTADAYDIPDSEDPLLSAI